MLRVKESTEHFFHVPSALFLVVILKIDIFKYFRVQ
jgi:hypothetical protein